jgi:hypothetical protein
MGKKKTGKLKKGSSKSTLLEVDEKLGKSPFAVALAAGDEEALCKQLTQVRGKAVTKVDIVQTVGEKFTGGASTPVFLLTVHFEGGTESLVAKLVLIESTHPHADFQSASYHVEQRFYQYIADSVRQSSLKIPNLLLGEANSALSKGGVFCFLMDDLKTTHAAHPESLSMKQLMAALDWLARFHATFWDKPTPQMQAGGLVCWRYGGFWSLDKDVVKKGEGAVAKVSDQWAQTLRFIQKKEPGMASEPGIIALGSRIQASAKAIQICMRGIAADETLEALSVGQRKGVGKSKGGGGGGSGGGSGGGYARFRTVIHGLWFVRRSL